MDKPFVSHSKRLAIVAVAAADVAGDVNVRQEIHLDPLHPVAFACLAASAFDVERETAGLVTTRPRFGQHRVKFAKRREQSGKRRRIRTRRAADRCLVDLDDLVHEIEALDRIVFERFDRRFIDVFVERRIEDFLDQRRFARTRNARHDR